MKGILGALKFESGDSLIQVFAGLAAKLYSMKLVDILGLLHYDKKGKGIPKHINKMKTTHEEYEYMLDHPTYDSQVSFDKLASEGHQMQKRRLTKRKLTATNHKVFQSEAKRSRPLGHYLKAQSSSFSA